MTDIERLQKIEEKMYEIAQDELNLDFDDIEWDIIPSQRMLEIMAYRSPVNISNWKFGRDFEKQRTIYENVDPSLPYELVINSNPARAYLMKENPFSVQVLVMAHVIGHCAFFKMNKYFQSSRKDIMSFMSRAAERFIQYESTYGISNVEMIEDAAHALQFHSNPFDDETEDERRKRKFNEIVKSLQNDSENTSEFGDILRIGKSKSPNFSYEEVKRRLWNRLKNTHPVEPTEDILRYIIDEYNLDDWQSDILETLRAEGQYYWPIMKTKFMNEGFAVTVHQKIMKRLFEENYLTNEEYAQYNYSNSLVKAEHPMQMNPYLIGSKIWEDIEDRWNKGRYGEDFDEETDYQKKKNWNTEDNQGWNKCLQVLRTYTDWFFMQDFLTTDLVYDLNLYIYVKSKGLFSDYYVVAEKSDLEQIRDLIVNSFGQNITPKIKVYQDSGSILYLIHNWNGMDLNEEYAYKTMEHIANLVNKSICLYTYEQDKNENKNEIMLMLNSKGDRKKEYLNLFDTYEQEENEFWYFGFLRG